MVSWNDVRQWSAAGMRAIGDDLTGQLKKLQGTEAELLDAATPSEWEGEGAEAAKRSLDGIEQGVQNRVAEFAALRTAVDDAAERIKQLRDAMREIEDTAAGNDFAITDGRVVPRPGADFAEPGRGTPELNTEVIAALEERIEQILRAALDVDADLCTVMLSITEGNIDDDGATTLAAAAAAGAEAGESTVTAPPKNATPVETKAWWDTLSPAERDSLIKNRPELIGNRDGIPVRDRHQANRNLLERQKQDLLDRRDELKEKLAKYGGSYRGGARFGAELEAIEGKLNGIGAIEAKLDKNETTTTESDKYYLLKIDTAGDGQAILAKGNPDTADNVATYVPGTGQDLSNIGGNIDRSDKMHDYAGQSDPSKTTSVITYMGYDAPDDLLDASEQSYAHGGKKNLDSFQDGLRATHEGSPSNNTVLGHSYGFVTAAVTAHDEGLAVNNLIAVGAPGGVYEHASSLGVENVYSTIAEEDPVNDQPFHGPDADADWGAREFESSPSKYDDWINTKSHSEYWDRQNKALWNMGHIIAGNPGRAVS